jgi:hypothetical protein
VHRRAVRRWNVVVAAVDGVAMQEPHPAGVDRCVARGVVDDGRRLGRDAGQRQRSPILHCIAFEGHRRAPERTCIDVCRASGRSREGDTTTHDVIDSMRRV